MSTSAVHANRASDQQYIQQTLAERPLFFIFPPVMEAGFLNKRVEASLYYIRSGQWLLLLMFVLIIAVAWFRFQELLAADHFLLLKFVEFPVGATILFIIYGNRIPRVHAPERAFEVTLAWLVISCPCALSLAIPAAYAAASSTLARLGVLPVRAGGLERLAAVDTVVFDKTGTLGDGAPQLDATRTFGTLDADAAQRIAAALERESTHPLAKAFAGVDGAARVQAVTVHAGAGIEGVVDGMRWRLGHAAFAFGGTDDGALWLADGQRAAARFGIREHLREDAAAALAALSGLGIDAQLLSGDGEAAVRRVADTLGIEKAFARQLPEQKLARLRELQAGGHVVAMVGDGVNDAPVLAGADVSFAIGDGAALATRSADLVLASPALLRIPEAIALARRSRTVVRQNLGWALGYNLLALPVAALGLVTPWLAALGMALSSLAVTLNALRLARTARIGGPR